MKKILSFLTAILFAGSMMATDYQKVTSASDLVVGAKYVIGTDAGSFMSTESYANNRRITTTTVNDGVVTATDAMMVFTLGGSADAWTFATDNYLGTAGYLNATSTTGSNYLKVVATLDDYAYFTVAIEEGVTTITCNGKESRHILYQNGSTCFACYNNQTSSQYSKPNLYKEVTGGGEPEGDPQTVYLNVNTEWYDNLGEKFAIYAFEDGKAEYWSPFLSLAKDETVVYKGEIPAGYTNLIFVRFGSASTEPGWDNNKLNQTADLKIQTNGNDMFVITGRAYGEGYWAKYTAGGSTEPEETVKLYYVKEDAWNDAINAYVWVGEDVYAAWPGTAMTKLTSSFDKPVYEISFPAKYTSIIFNDGTYQTNDMLWDAANPYYYAGKWYASLTDIKIDDDPVDPETPVDSMTVYYVNKAAWEAVNAFVWPAEGSAYKEWPGEAMTKQEEKINDLDVYAYTFPASYVNIIFNNGTAQTADLVWNADAPYYYDGVWYAKADIPAGGETPAADFTKPFVLTFNGTGESGKDASAAFTADVAAIFDAASAPYVASVETATKVYAGRPIADDNSSVKFGTTSAQGSLEFTLAQAIEVDSIIVNATQYGSNASKITVNGTEFELNAGNKVPQDCKITPEGKVSAISIAQSSSERLYLRNIRVYPKTSTPEPPTPEVVYSVAGSKALLGAEWNEAEGNEMTLDPKDGLYKLLCADVTLAGDTEYKFKIVTNHDWSNPNYPDQDKVLTVDKDGKYDVTITFNADTKDVAYVAEFKGSAVVEKHYLIVGEKAVANGEYWNNAADINLLKSADEGLTYTLVVENAELKAETPYGYKVVEQGSWTEYFPNIGGDNAYISVEADGVYTITYTYTVATSQCVAVTTKTGDIPGPIDPPTPGTVYYMKNNWEAGADWTWKEMTQDGDIYKLENVVFGGYGVNYSTSMEDLDPAWVPVDDILGDEIAAKDTVTFVLNPVKATVTATLIGKYQDGGDTPEPPTPTTTYYMKNNWEAGADWTWKEMTQDGEIYKLENVVFGGTGVNYNTAESDEGAAWVAVDDILGDEIAAKDTVTFVLNPVKATVTATIVGKYVDPVPPTPEEYVTLYFVNVDKWENVYAYVWNDDYNVGELAGWPGTKMTITEDSVGDYAVYSFTFATKYNKVIFDNGSGGAGNQTSDMIWNAATPYYYDGIWYASLDDINPAAETKFYISGDMSLVGAGSVWDPKAIKSLEDSYTLHLQRGTYMLKISLDGTEDTWKGYSDLSEITPGLTLWGANNAIAFSLAEEGDVVVTYKVVNEVVTFTVVGKFFTIESGYYLMSMNKTLFDFTEADKFAPNTGTEGEYMLNTTLTEGDQIAVVMVANNVISMYYYGASFYYVDANHAGATTIYFRPEGNAEWTETGGYFYVVPTSTTGIEETIAAGKAAKVLRNGQILILKGDKMYNVMGAVIH